MRHRRALTLDELAQRSGLGKRTIEDIEGRRRGVQGHAHSSTVKRLAEGLELTGPEREEFIATGLHVTEEAAGEEAAGAAPFGPPFNLEALPEPPAFVGRKQESQWLVERLTHREPLTIISGMAGIGKTSLAAVAVHRVRAMDQFPDGMAIVRCHNLTDAATVLRATLNLFDPRRRPPDATDLLTLGAEAHRLLDGRRALVVLENIEPGWPTEDVLDPLMESGAIILATARQRILPGRIPTGASCWLDLLSQAEAIDLFAYGLGRDGDAALTLSEHQAADKIVTTLGRHTLAVWLAGVHAQVESRDLGVLAHELEEPFNVLDLPDGEVPHVVANAFARSTAQLPLDTRRLLAALAAFPAADIGRRAVLALGDGLSYSAPRECVSQLKVRALLDAYVLDEMPAEGDRERLRLHPLMQAVALSLFRRWPEVDVERVQRAIASYYAGYSHRVSERALFYDDRNITGAVEWMVNQDQPALLADLCQGVWRFWRSHSRMAERLRYLPAAYDAATQLASVGGQPAASVRKAYLALAQGQLLFDTGDREGATQLLKQSLVTAEEYDHLPCVGAALSALGEVARAQGQVPEAKQYFERSLTTWRHIQDRQGEGVALSYLGEIAEFHGHREEAERYFRQALLIRREVGDRPGEAVELSYLAELAILRGKLDEAEEYLEQSLPIRQELRDRRGEGVDRGFYGQIAKLRGQFEVAERCFLQCIAIDRELHDRPGEAVDSSYLGQIAEARGDLTAAERYFRECLTSFRAVHDRPGEGIGLANLGRIALAAGQLQEAEEFFTQSLQIRREVEDRKGEGRVRDFLGRVHRALGHTHRALAEFEAGLAIAREVEDRPGETGTLYRLAELAETLGDVVRAEAQYRASLALADEIHSEPEGAQACLALGQLLVRRNHVEEGRRLIVSAVRRFAAMHHPGEHGAREAALRLGCSPDV